MKWGAVIGGVALAALPASLSASSSARAADLTPIPRATSSSYIPAQFLWTGFYLGGGIGYGWGTAPFVDPVSGATATPSLSGFLVSGVTGLNYQVGSLVVGGEFDFTGSWAKGSAVDATGNNLQTSVFWTASITGRLGWAFDRLLVYGKGGVAFDYDRDRVTVSGAATDSSTYRTGWTVGGGAEYAITEHWTGRVEYDYLKFPTQSLSFLQGRAIGASTVIGNVGLSLNEIKLIMAYKF